MTRGHIKARRQRANQNQGEEEDDRVLYARKNEEGFSTPSDLGGTAITVEDACKLKTVCWGGPNIVPRNEWVKAGLVFHEAEQLFGYGLNAPKGAAKSFQLVLQAYILKHLMFEGKAGKKARRIGGVDSMNPVVREKPLTRGRPVSLAAILRPTETIQRDILVGAITELLWKCGEKERAVLAVPDAAVCFEPPSKFSIDGVTEKLHFVTCNKEEELKVQVKKFMGQLTKEKGGGVACLLYSVVLSCGFKQLAVDMQDKHDMPLITADDTITMCLANLMMTGSATPYLHNGIMEPGDGDDPNFDYGEGKVGITGRNEMGLLVWQTNEYLTNKLGLGSRMKTPVLPIWITCVNDNWGVLFNPNRDLMKNYSAENRFQLYYYSNCQMKEVLKERRETILTIDTRGTRPKFSQEYKDNDPDNDDPEEERDPLQTAVQTKWEGAMLDWQGLPCYV